ncbi:MAG: hypothetical protein AB1782_02310 [Cyanobacteriota bacterium]
MHKTSIINISENEITTEENVSQNMVKITFETDNNGQQKTETITLVGHGTLKSTILV